MMLGEESKSATYWEKCGDAALANGIEHVVMMVRTLHLPFPSQLTSTREHTGPPSATQSK